jgi:hypothetical protein
MEPEISLLKSQVPATCPYPEPASSSPHNPLEDVASNILVTVHTSHHPTVQHHNNYNRTENHKQWNAVRPPDDGLKDARNMFRINLLRINHYLLHLVGLTFIYMLLLGIVEFVSHKLLRNIMYVP